MKALKLLLLVFTLTTFLNCTKGEETSIIKEPKEHYAEVLYQIGKPFVLNESSDETIKASDFNVKEMYNVVLDGDLWEMCIVIESNVEINFVDIHFWDKTHYYNMNDGYPVTYRFDHKNNTWYIYSNGLIKLLGNPIYHSDIDIYFIN